MPPKRNLLAVILGGGAGSRLFPLTRDRSKPAVPLGGKYRLVDVPISNCINSDVIRMFVLTQFNSASLNRHIATTYRFSPFADGFVEILAAEQTPERPDWFQGTADAVRQVLPHIRDWRIDTLLILSGDHLYRMDYRKFLKRHFDTDAIITVSAIPPFNLFDAEAPLFTRARYLPPSKINNCEIRDSMISEGCIINGAKINRSLIGLRGRVGEGTHIDATYMMGADYYQTLEDMVRDREANRPRIGIGEQ